MTLNESTYETIIETLVTRIHELEGLIQRYENNYRVIPGRPHSEVTRLKMFMEIFNALSGQDRNDIEEKNFINELVKTGRFSEVAAREFIHKAMLNGQIYEKKEGFYAKP